MKVLLVYPKDIAENYFAKRPVMGIGYIGTCLEKKGYDVRLVDMRVKGYDIKFFEKTLEEFKPDVVGYTLVALSLNQAYELMKIVRKKLPNAINVAGGPEVTLLPKKILSYDFVDFVFTGEGEYSFPEFLDKYEKGEDYSRISGLGFKRKIKIRTDMQDDVSKSFSLIKEVG